MTSDSAAEELRQVITAHEPLAALSKKIIFESNEHDIFPDPASGAFSLQVDRKVGKLENRSLHAAKFQHETGDRNFIFFQISELKRANAVLMAHT